MQIDLILIVFLAILATQLIIGGIALWNMRGLQRKFSHPLGSKVTTVELLEKYSRIFSPINIKVDAHIKRPAVAKLDTLHVNKRSVYTSNLYNNFYTLVQVMLLLPAYRMLLRLRNAQAIGFVVELGIFVVSFYVFSPMRVISVFIGLVLLVTSFLYQSYLNDLMTDAYDVGVDILDFDEVERGRTKHLIHEMQSEAFIYSWQPLGWLIGFLNPFNRSAP